MEDESTVNLTKEDHETLLKDLKELKEKVTALESEKESYENDRKEHEKKVTYIAFP